MTETRAGRETVRWIYFDSARTGEQQVFKIPASGGEAIQVTRDGGFAPVESADGKFLYYTKALFPTSLWKTPLEVGQATKILEGLSSYITWPLWTAACISFLYKALVRSGS